MGNFTVQILLLSILPACDLIDTAARIFVKRNSVAINKLGVLGLNKEIVIFGIMFRYLCIGYMFYVMVKSIMILLLYFDDRGDALKLAALFALSSILGSVVTLALGINYYGLGFVLAAVLSTVYGLYLLKHYVDHLEYHVFCNQPLFGDVTDGVFTTVGGELNEKFNSYNKKRIFRFRRNSSGSVSADRMSNRAGNRHTGQ